MLHVKKKLVPDNPMLFFDKELSKAIMTTTKLRNNFLQKKSEENRKPYAKQRNFCLSFEKDQKEIFRSSHRRCSVKKGVPRNFAKFTGTHLYQRLFFNKVAGLRQKILF